MTAIMLSLNHWRKQSDATVHLYLYVGSKLNAPKGWFQICIAPRMSRWNPQKSPSEKH